MWIARVASPFAALVLTSWVGRGWSPLKNYKTKNPPAPSIITQNFNVQRNGRPLSYLPNLTSKPNHCPAHASPCWLAAPRSRQSRFHIVSSVTGKSFASIASRPGWDLYRLGLAPYPCPVSRVPTGPARTHPSSSQICLGLGLVISGLPPCVAVLHVSTTLSFPLFWLRDRPAKPSLNNSRRCRPLLLYLPPILRIPVKRYSQYS